MFCSVVDGMMMSTSCLKYLFFIAGVKGLFAVHLAVPYKSIRTSEGGRLHLGVNCVQLAKNYKKVMHSEFVKKKSAYRQ